MNCRTESERFCGRQGGWGKIAAGVAKYYVEDDFGPANAARTQNKPLECKGILLDALKHGFYQLCPAKSIRVFLRQRFTRFFASEDAERHRDI
jgi:hypothetical protein